MDLLPKFSKDHEEVNNLANIEDPPEKPYESKYKARELLEAMLKELEKADLEGTLSASIYVHLTARLGGIDHEVDEWAKSQKSLESGLEKAEKVQDMDRIIIPYLVCLNQLGILWCSRGELEKGKGFLVKALERYEKFVEDGTDKIFDTVDILNPDSATPNSPERRKALDLLNTHTYYFLAQFYEKIGEKDKAGECCHITLKKQLELDEYKPLDWAANAFTLSHYYLAHDKFPLAKHHIAAARFVLEKYKVDLNRAEFPDEEAKSDAMDKFSRCSASVDRAVGKYCLVLLQKAVDKAKEGEDNQKDGGMKVEDLDSNDFESQGQHGEFTSVRVPEELLAVPQKLCTDFESAREIFLPGQRYLNAAKEKYFTLDEHCTDYVEIQQDLSALHKALVYFELDFDRRFKIHKRRIDLLEKPLKELNRSLYLLVCRQLMYELAETYESMMDAKLDLLKSKKGPQSNEVVKVNTLIDRGINYFISYLETLKDSKTGEMPQEFYHDSVRPALVAYFHLARMWDKYVVPENSEVKLRNKMQTLSYFKRVVDYCERNPDAETVIPAELPLCREMVNLLPIQIEKIRMNIRS